MDGRTGEQAGGLVDEWIDGWMDEWTDISLILVLYCSVILQLIYFYLIFQLIVEVYPNPRMDMFIILMGTISKVLPHTLAIFILN